MKATTIFAFTLLGFAATIGQILVLRELLTVFSGTELAVAVVLAAWLFWTALGGLLGGKLSQHYRGNPRLFGYLQMGSGIILALTIFLIRSARSFFQVGAGELVTWGQMLAISFLTVAPFCLISGLLFSLACSVLGVRISRWRRSPGLVYFLEGLGAGIGGLLFTLVLIHHFNGLKIAISIGLLLCTSGLFIALHNGRKRSVDILIFACIFLGLATVQYRSTDLDRASRQWQWSGFHLLDSQETIYGHIVVVAKENQITFFESGLWNFTVPDQLSAEEAVHYGLLQHPQPERVLLIGGGVSGSLAQLLLHPSIREVEYVELDPKLIQLGKTYLPRDVTAALQDGRATVLHEDGRSYLSHTSRKFDVILVNLPEPFTAQINRFYTQEFFRLASSKMRGGGVFFFTASAAETALGPTQSRYMKLLYRTASSVFPEVVIFPGQTARFFCSNSPGTLTKQPETLVNRLRQRKLELFYVQDHYILWDLSPLRQESFMAMIEQADEDQENSDLNPRAYSYNLLLWGSQYSPMIAKTFSALSKRTIWITMLFFCVVVAVVSVAKRLRSGASQIPKMRILYSVTVFGLTGISLEILIIFSFQVFFGYVYYQIGILLALFMVGLAMGSFTFSYYPRNRPLHMKTLVIFQFALACFCLGLAFMFAHFSDWLSFGRYEFLYRETFSVVTLVAGFLGGAHFPLANRILLEEQPQVGPTAGLVYAIDLLGSFLGCLSVGLVFIPSMGIYQTLFILALINLTAILPFIIRWPTQNQLGTRH
ncbi:MAG: fused MFS/spermidine synthase [Syntrophobacterales bacterium]|jgi:spermidine synthase